MCKVFAVVGYWNVVISGGYVLLGLFPYLLSGTVLNKSVLLLMYSLLIWKQYSRQHSFFHYSFTHGAVIVAALMPLPCRFLVYGHACVSMQSSAQKAASACLLLLFLGIMR